jgi:hypothetical protein
MLDELLALAIAEEHRREADRLPLVRSARAAGQHAVRPQSIAQRALGWLRGPNAVGSRPAAHAEAKAWRVDG